MQKCSTKKCIGESLPATPGTEEIVSESLLLLSGSAEFTIYCLPQVVGTEE